MENRDGYRNWWLVRQEGAAKSYVLSAMVLTDYDTDGDQPVFESTIAGLEDRLVAHGETYKEAEEKAMQVLHDMLEAALKSEGLDACFAGVKGFSAKLVEVPFDQMVEVFRTYVESASARQRREAKELRRPPSSTQWCAEPTGEVVPEDCVA